MTVHRRALTDGWELRLEAADPTVPAPALPEVVPATVPGCVHTDLLSSGLISDPYLDENELALDWIGRQTWSYTTHFSWFAGDTDVPAGSDRIDLVCDGLDTVATVLVNGRNVGTFANQHRSYRIPLDAALQHARRDLADRDVKDIEIKVVFGSAWAYAQDLEQRLGGLPNAYPAPFNFIRKMACNFGWDWGPTVVTAGIWKPIAVESWSTARLAAVRPAATVNGADGHIRIDVDLERVADTALVVSADVAGQHTEVTVAAGATVAQLDLDVPDIDLWWPHDLGAQPLYDLTVTLYEKVTLHDEKVTRHDEKVTLHDEKVTLHESPAGDPGAALDRWQRRIGFRTIRLDTTADDVGSAFTLVVNDVPIFARGANWIPDDCFPARITAPRLRSRIQQGVEANINLLRVWGGGIYESDDFYDVCDELGVLVWQDFLFACAAYPEEEPIRSEVIAEATENVARLMPHPSLVIWNGCNENIWGWFDWQWQEPVGDRTWGAGYYLKVLPEIVATIDPGRPYFPGSPYSGSMDIHPNDDDHGLRHIWDVWNSTDYTEYRDHIPRFVAEFGYQGPPNLSTIRRSIHDHPLTPNSPGMLHHQKAADGNGKLARGAAPHLPVVETFDEWHYLMQLNQSEAIRFGIEHFRSHRGRCMGTVVWQLNDCWPVTSWAAIDGDGRKKLLWHGLRAAYAPRLLTIQPRGGVVALIGVNDSGVAWRGAARVERRQFDGTLLADFDAALVVDPLATATLALPARVTEVGDAAGEYLLATAPGGEQALWFFTEDKDLDLRPNVLTIDVRHREDGFEVTVQATSLARHVALIADRWHPDAVVDQGAVTIPAGGSHTFGVTVPSTISPDGLAGAVICLNDLVATSGGPSTHGPSMHGPSTHLGLE